MARLVAPLTYSKTDHWFCNTIVEYLRTITWHSHKALPLIKIGLHIQAPYVTAYHSQLRLSRSCHHLNLILQYPALQLKHLELLLSKPHLYY